MDLEMVQLPSLFQWFLNKKSFQTLRACKTFSNQMSAIIPSCYVHSQSGYRERAMDGEIAPGSYAIVLTASRSVPSIRFQLHWRKGCHDALYASGSSLSVPQRPHEFASKPCWAFPIPPRCDMADVESAEKSTVNNTLFEHTVKGPRGWI